MGDILDTPSVCSETLEKLFIFWALLAHPWDRERLTPASEKHWEESGMEGKWKSSRGIIYMGKIYCQDVTSLFWEAMVSLSYGLQISQNVKLQGTLDINQEHS